MKRINNAFMWCFMLSKRLYKKITFVVLLLLIPVTVLAFGKAAEEESGVLTILLSQEDPSDSFSANVINDFLDSSELILFKKVDDSSEAERLVQIEKADAAWIFPKDMEDKIQEFITDDAYPKSFVRVVVREETVPIMLANEKLSGALFKYCARFYYLYYMRQNADFLDVLSDEELLSYYDSAQISDQLFEYYSMNESGGSKRTEHVNYLLSPMRGLLGVIIVLCGLATALYYIHDDRSGTFAWLDSRKKPILEMGYQLISVFNVSIVALICLCCLGVSVSLVRELVVLILYALCCASFCQMIRVLCGSIRIVGTLLPLLTVLMIAVCPVFYDFAALRSLQILLPPTYFVNAVYNIHFIWYMLIYTVICQIVSFGGRLALKRA